ncbi:MAG: hypothetical protein M1839_008631 [Geoglossum umbratile]|nr:MAG: hypothetical protein M1839_008631 [Geoglossum umbratile]
MFRNRTNSQKPGDDLYERFRQSFPQVAPSSTSTSEPNIAASLSETLCDPTLNERGSLGQDHGDIKDLDPTPRAPHEPWRFTPSLLDPNSLAFATFANQPPGYYTPTPGGTNALYHSQAGDLHTPNMGISVGAPLSLPTTTATGLHAVTPAAGVHDFTPQTIQSQQFHNFNPFAAHNSFVPGQFTEQPTGFESMDASPDESPIRNISEDTSMQDDSPVMAFHPGHFDANMACLPPKHIESFRFHVTLHAPTAMVKHADEVPVTYLNKGQAYSMSIIDTTPPIPNGLPIRYRTFVRISFEDEQQRQRPGACWQLWKEGRGTSEAHQRGGKLLAVEYVETNQPSESDSKHTRVEIETASFDGFSALWSSGPNSAADCSVAVRFNFLSTDFSHSKGVKGIPVRLCAKTEVIGSGSPRSPTPSSPEICYCKVKLFRDHGAERKLSNDVVHVKKTIDKLKQQVSQAETGMRDFSRKKRLSSTASKTAASAKPGKVPKHKRTWSMSSASSSGGGRPPAEEDLQLKLSTMQAMFTSTQPVSILYLRGSEHDDPDLHPVRLPGESQDPINHERKDSVWSRRQSVPASSTTRTSSLVSPSPSSTSLQSQGVASIEFPSGGYNQFGQGRSGWGNFQSLPTVDLLHSPNPQHLASPPDQPVRIPRTSSGDLSGWIEALDVNSSYRAPSERPIKPGEFVLIRKRQNISNLTIVACIYILPAKSEKLSKIQYYRAVYFMERTVQEFTANIAAKFGIELTWVARTTYVNSKGLNVIIDDDFVREIPEGQDMRIEVIEIRPEAPRVKREWHIGPGEDDDDFRAVDSASPTKFEIRVLF